MSTSKVKEAVACYDEILKLNANHAEALVKKGSALEKLKQDELCRVAEIGCFIAAANVRVLFPMACQK